MVKTDADPQLDLAFDTDSHRIWLDAFVSSPLPAFVVVRAADAAGHTILLANTAAIVMTGRDLTKLQLDTLECWIGADSGTMRQLPRSFQTGCEFTMPITGVDEAAASPRPSGGTADLWRQRRCRQHCPHGPRSARPRRTAALWRQARKHAIH